MVVASLRRRDGATRNMKVKLYTLHMRHHAASVVRKGSRCASLCIVLLLWAARVHASPPFELAGSVLSTGASAGSAYFNPALLANARPGVELGVFVLQDSIQINLGERDARYDIPEVAVGQFQGQMPSLPTSWIQSGCDPQMGACASRLDPHPRRSATSGTTRMYLVLGLVATVFDRYLTLGVYGMAPTGTLLRGNTFYSDEREQYFSNNLHPELYEDRLDAPAMAMAASSRLLDWLAVGVGATLGLTTGVTAGTFVGNSARIAQSLVLSTALESSMIFAPHVGALIEPTSWLSFSLTAHAPQKQDMINVLDSYLPNGDFQRANRSVVLAWMPWSFAVGSQVDVLRLPGQRFSAVAGMTLALWSDYLDRVGERPRDGYLWANTLSTNAGLRHVYKEMVSSFVDFQYAPSPVPAQTGRTNYVDNDRLGFTGGTNVELPLSGTRARLRFGLQAQLHFLLDRYQAKLDPTSERYAGKFYPGLVVDEWKDDSVSNRGEVIAAAANLQTNNSGWPGFGSRGTIWGAGINVALLY
jgi:long-chain fatty acid transport protein